MILLSELRRRGRKQLFGRSLNHDSLPPAQLEPELHSCDRPN
jgi:hypothetical protein